MSGGRATPESAGRRRADPWPPDRGEGATTASGQFAPSTASFMANQRVEDARALATVLRDEGCNVLDESEYGVFARVIDPEGNKVELWGPPARE